MSEMPRPGYWRPRWREDSCRWFLIVGTGNTLESCHNRKRIQLPNRCCGPKVRLNEDKICLKQFSVPYIGYFFNSEGVKVDYSKLEAILKMEKPRDMAGVQKIIGDYKLYILPQLLEFAEPVRQLTKINAAFEWDQNTINSLANWSWWSQNHLEIIWAPRHI